MMDCCSSLKAAIHIFLQYEKNIYHSSHTFYVVKLFQD